MNVLVMYSPNPPTPDHIRRLESLDSRMTVSVATSERDAIEKAPAAEVILGQRYLRQVLPHAPQLRWVQSTSGGTDHLPEEELAEHDITLTRFTGASSIVAQHAITLAWALTRGVPDLVRQQLSGIWSKDLRFLPRPSRALILGTGTIGRAIARSLQDDGVHVTGVKRRVDGPIAGFDALHTGSDWRSTLPESDWCFLTLPRTASTTNMVDEEALRTLPPHAVLVNVGRGEILDHDALIRVLNDGHLGGAALDVVPHSMDPLPTNHPLWTTPRLLISPHVAGYDPSRSTLVERFIEKQMARYINGQALAEVVRPRVNPLPTA